MREGISLSDFIIFDLALAYYNQITKSGLMLLKGNLPLDSNK